jgi:potassium-dependent mechanosensitive channel
MLQFTKHTRFDYTRLDRTINFEVIRILLSLLMLLWLLPASAGTASLLKGVMQESSSKPASGQSVINPTALIEEIKLKLAATNKELALVPSEAVAGASAAGASGEERTLAQRLRFRELVFLYQGQLARLASLQLRQQTLADLESQAANWSGFTEPLLHPFLRADELKESLATLSRRADELESGIAAIEQGEEQAINIAEDSTVKLRQADEDLEQAKESPGQEASLDRARDSLALQNQIDLARAVGFQIEKQMVQKELQGVQAKLQLARKQLGGLSEQVELTQQDLDQVHKNIERQSQLLIAELKQAVSAPGLENKAGQQANPAASVTGEVAQIDGQDQLHQAQLMTADIKLQTLNRVLVYLQLQRDIWNLRWVYSKVTEREKAGEVYDKIAKHLITLKVIHDYLNRQRDGALERATSQTVSELDPAVSGADTLRDELKNLDLEQVFSFSRLLGAIETTESLLERSKQELDERFQVKSFSDYLEEAWLTARDVASQIWKFELFAVQDNIEVDGQIISGKRSVTVDKVVSALAILIIGYWFAAHLSRWFEGLAVRRFGMDASLALITRRWILFLEVLLLVVLSMLVVKIPLTIFAFMGGAVAIGAGFGMQNMLKNLISGIMLLFERPFRPGDVVEVGGIRGRVTDICARSSHIIDSNGIETVIPNSTFIEQNVTNWTLSSKSVRIVVSIGIAYGSPVKEVRRLLLEAADHHGLTLDVPAPMVLFEDFGSDALLFGLYVWVEINPDVSWKVIASDLRYMISKALDEHGIEIAFPQRDIHLDASRPLEVRVLADTSDIWTVKG